MPKHPPYPPEHHHFDDEDDRYDMQPPLPPHLRHRYWGLPIPNDFEEPILRELFGNSDQARAARRIFEASPPEIAILAYLLLRLYTNLKDEITSLQERLNQIDKVSGEEEIGKGG